MSLHIELSDNARLELNQQKKKNLLSSLVVSVLSFVLLTLVFIAAKIYLPDPPAIDLRTIPMPSAPDNAPVADDMPTSQPTTDSPPTVIAVNNATTTINIPIPPIPTNNTVTHQITPTTLIGSLSSGARGNQPSSLNPIFSKRCSPSDRLQRIKDAGGSPSYEEAVVKSLRWMMKKQNKDGSWGSGPNKAAYAGLSLLSYLAHCETPLSEEFGESCSNAISYLIGVAQKNNGYLSENPKDQYLPYEHAINTYALAEAYTFCEEQEVPFAQLKETVQTAYDLIVKNQASDGSWMYYYRQKADGSQAYPDMSVSGWNIQALKAVQHSPLKLSGSSMQKARNFVLKMGDPKSGLWVYNGNNRSTARPAMVPVGVLCLQMMGAGHMKEAKAGLKYMDEHFTPTPDNAYIYYYAAQALINRGGPIWDKYGKTLGDSLVTLQKTDGSWGIPGAETNKAFTLWTGHINGEGRVHYLTCLNTLTLEVFYRFLPGTGEGTRNVTGN